MEVLLESVEEMRALGALVGATAKAGGVVALNGDLGAGKTMFAQGVGTALGIERAVTSPTFVLVNTYEEGHMPLIHADLYRIEEESEAIAIGLDEQLESDVLGIVEWAERFPGVLPLEPLDVRILLVPGSPDRRNVRLEAVGTTAGDWLARIESAFSAS